MQSRFSAALGRLNAARRTIEGARGAGGELTPELRDNHLWELEERSIVLLFSGHLAAMAELVEELWRAAEERLEEVRAANGGALPEDFAGTDAAQGWVGAALQRLALAGAQRRFGRTVEIHDELAARPLVRDVLSDEQRARLRLHRAIAEVEALRRGTLPGARPVETLVAMIAELPPEPLSEDAFLARLYLGRAFLDAGDAAAAAEAAADLRARYERAGDDALDRYELLLAALESACLRAGAGGDELPAVLAWLERSFERYLERWSHLPPDESGLGLMTFEEWNTIGSELVALRMLARPGEAGVRDALEGVLRAQCAGSLARRLGARAPAVGELQEVLLGPGEGLLLYWMGRDATHLFAVDAADLRHFALGPDHRLDAVAEELRLTLADVLDPVLRADPASLAEPLRAAAEFFLPPEVQAAMTDWSGVAVVGLEGLAYLPFEMLPLAGGEELGLALAVRTWPSVLVAWSLHRRRAEGAGAPAAGRELLLFAAPGCGVPEALAGEYAFGADERAALVGPYGEGASRVLAGREASTAALARLHPRAARVAQLVVHGEYDPGRPRPAGLRAWGPDGPAAVWAEELEHPGFPELVLLTACEAGRAAARRGDDGVAHLGAAALYGGASSVLLSYTAVGYRPALKLASRFHGHLRDGGKPPAEALLHARRECVREAGPLDRPHYFLVRLSGLGDAPLFEPRPGRAAPDPLLVAGGLAALLVLGGIALYLGRRR